MWPCCGRCIGKSEKIEAIKGFGSKKRKKGSDPIFGKIGSDPFSGERRLNLTAPQGRFLYHLPFPTAEPLSVLEIMARADLDDEHRAEIADLVNLLEAAKVIEVCETGDQPG